MNSIKISSVAVAAMVAFTVGCADGQRQAGAGRGKQMYRTAGPGGKLGASAKGPGDLSTVLPKASDAKNEQSIQNAVASLEQGMTNNPQLDADEYLLEGWATLFSNGNPPAQALRGVTVVNETPVKPTPILPTGTIKAASTATLVIPLRFAISREGELEHENTDRLLTTTTAPAAKGSFTFDEKLTKVDPSTIDSSANLETIVKNARLGTTTVASQNITAEFKGVSKPDANHLRVAVILNQNNGEVVRTIYVDYKKLGANDRTPAPAPAPKPEAEPAVNDTGVQPAVPN